MADVIQCPLCGTENPPTNKICQRCQTPLSGEAFQPGQAPVRKDTSELEPILPQWLKDARESAKQLKPIEPPKKDAPLQPSASGMDFLAGLQSQAGADADEEVPDWLASITGTAGPKHKPEEAETGGVRWVETGKKDDFLQNESSDEEMPNWLAGIQAPQPGADEKDELTEWFRESEGEGFSQPPLELDSTFSAPPKEEAPDWLKQMAADAGEQKEEAPADASIDASDWFGKVSEEPTSASPLQPSSNESSGTPDWLSQMQSGANAAPQSQPAETFDLPSDTPDWLSGLGGASAAEPAPFVESAPAESEPLVSDGEVPAWLAPEESKKSDSTPLWLQEDAAAGAPAWVASEQETIFTEPEKPAQDDIFGGDVPDWLKAAAPQSSIYDEPARDDDSQADVFPPPVSPFESAPAFSEEALPAAGGDALFTDMPDWLSSAVETPSASAASEPITGSDALSPNVLPSWVEAMRPMDSSASGGVPQSNDQTLEARGALAGLQGVLPAGAGFLPTSKPKSLSIKLSASDEQVRHAEILERILAAETAPEALASEPALGASRRLRWGIALVLTVVIFATALLRSQFFSAPMGVPNELSYAAAVAGALPENAPVLVAVDYEAARAAEMEAAAAPLFDNLLLLKHPRLTFIASNEAGAILSERLMNGPLAVHNYQGGVTYLNLGYLSGGQMGIRAFSQNPSFAAPMDIFSQPAWGSAPLQGVAALNQFAAVILITDNADAARAWIEQTQPARGSVPLLVVSSAQAAPLIQPYYDSGQAAGMVTGLYGGAIFERQYNNGRPGMARNYWDAYSLGMFFAMMLVLGGGFVNLALGLRDRAAAQGGK